MDQQIAAQVIGLGGANDFSLWQLFLRADFVVKSVIILLSASSIYSWALIFDKYKLFKKINLSTLEFENKFWKARSAESLHGSLPTKSEDPLTKIFQQAMSELIKTKSICTNCKKKKWQTPAQNICTKCKNENKIIKCLGDDPTTKNMKYTLKRIDGKYKWINTEKRFICSKCYLPLWIKKDNLKCNKKYDCSFCKPNQSSNKYKYDKYKQQWVSYSKRIFCGGCYRKKWVKIESNKCLHCSNEDDKMMKSEDKQ